MKLLKTIPGIGVFFARLNDADINDISRLRTPKKLANDAGLLPSTYSSGGKSFRSKIIKQGNKWLRWAFVEAVALAIAASSPIRAFEDQGSEHGACRDRARAFDDRLPVPA